jgi:hypothetical protein
MKHRERQTDGTAMIGQPEDTDDSRKKLERVDVSPFGTEGIFIDADPPVKEDGKNKRVK